MNLFYIYIISKLVIISYINHLWKLSYLNSYESHIIVNLERNF